MTTIAFLGLGHMGGPMAANLVNAGYTVRGFDPVPAARQAATDKGVTAVERGSDAVKGADVVITMLPNGTLVKLRFPDDDADIEMRVVNFIEETPAGEEDTTLTADSPLGLALFGRKAGETITYRTPRGELQVKLLAIEQP